MTFPLITPSVLVMKFVPLTWLEHHNHKVYSSGGLLIKSIYLLWLCRPTRTIINIRVPRLFDVVKSNLWKRANLLGIFYIWDFFIWWSFDVKPFLRICYWSFILNMFCILIRLDFETEHGMIGWSTDFKRTCKKKNAFEAVSMDIMICMLFLLGVVHSSVETHAGGIT